MKILCPVCGIDGIVQIRGKSVRIQHYQGFSNGKRIYGYHKIDDINLLPLTSNTPMEVNTLDLNREVILVAGGEGFEPSTLSLEG